MFSQKKKKIILMNVSFWEKMVGECYRTYLNLDFNSTSLAPLHVTLHLTFSAKNSTLKSKLRPYE